LAFNPGKIGFAQHSG